MIVEFVCTANMCRSPLAEALLRQRLADGGVSGITARSSGVFASLDRPAVEAVIRVGGAAGLDLAAHRSRPFDPASLSRTDLLVVMEERHRRLILESQRIDPKRIRLLGSYDPSGGGAEIDDPIGGPDIAFEQCIGRLRRCIDALAVAEGLIGPR